MYSSETNDAALVIRIAGGDHLALLTLYDRYVSILLALAQHIMGPGSEAEELIHDVFLEVWRRAGGYQPQHGTVRAWMVLRTRELALEAVRLQPELSAQHTPDGFFPGNTAEPPESPDNSFEDPLFDQERLLMQAALASLNDTQRAVLELAFFQAMPHHIIATHLDMPGPDVAAHLAAAHQTLRQALQDTRR